MKSKNKTTPDRKKKTSRKPLRKSMLSSLLSKLPKINFSFLKKLITFKVSLLAAALCAATILALPIAYKKAFRSYIGASVFIVRDVDQERGSGSGFVVQNKNGKKFFITNNHVCEGLSREGRISVESALYSSNEMVLQVLKTFPEVDLCIATAPENARALTISTNLSAGDTVHLFGHPVGFPLHEMSGEAIGQFTVRLPIIESLEDLIRPRFKEFDAWQISALSSPGNSGSPVVDNLGRVIGILFAGSSVNSYTSFIIPASSLVNALESM